MSPTRSRINLRAYPAPNDPVLRIDVIAVYVGPVILVFFEDCEAPGWGSVPSFARGDWAVDRNLIPNHEVSALPGERNQDVGVVRRDVL